MVKRQLIDDNSPTDKEVECQDNAPVQARKILRRLVGFPLSVICTYGFSSYRWLPVDG